MTFRIEEIHAREVLDSRGRPTVEADVFLRGGRGRAIVPSGASTGRHEAVELRDGGDRHDGRGVRTAVSHVNDLIGPALTGMDATLQRSVDERLIALDGTSDKGRLGANALLAVSLGVARAAADAARLPLWRYLGGVAAHLIPQPMINLFSGGLHADGAMDFQDFQIAAISAVTYREALEMIGRVHRATAAILADDGHSLLKADEGGFAPALASNDAGLELLVRGIERAGLRPGDDIAITVDVAASHFHDPGTGRYRLAAEGRELDSGELISMLEDWVSRFPIVSIEDGLGEDDWAGWAELTARLGDAVQLIGDDLFTTNIDRLERGIAEGCANAVLVKVNQIGTLTETLDVIDRCRQVGYRTVVSARSGETEDSSMADIAVATGAGQIKVGSLQQSERLAKYNQLLRIEEALGAEARLPDASIYRRPGDARTGATT